MGRRRRQSEFEDFIEIAAKLPWWASVGLAVVSYRVLHGFATGHGVAPGGLQGLGGAVGGQLIRTFAGFGQYLLPFGLLVAALVSAVKGWQRRGLHKRVAGSTDPKSLEQMSWREFEMLVGEVFRRRGYVVGEKGGHGADGGVDLVLSKGGRRFLAQCKQWKRAKVGVKIIRELYGVIAAEGAAGGFIVTSGVFTGDAVAFAAGKNIDLIDGPQLRSMIAGASNGQGEAARPAMPPPVAVAPSAESAPACPQCGSAMVRRVARRGAKVGKAFWGCSTFPKCRGTVPIE